MAKRKTAAKSAAKSKNTDTPAQEMLEVTWTLKGKLKCFQIYFLRIGELLAHVRDNKLYTALHHDNMEDYADKRLNLGRSSLYQYLDVHDWAVEFHPAWVKPKPAGYIPNLTTSTNLMWIERTLKTKTLDPATRAKLIELDAKGLAGKLRPKDVDEFRARSRPDSDFIKSFLSRLRTLRKAGVRSNKVPAEAISKIDDVIEVIQNTISTQKTGYTVTNAA